MSNENNFEKIGSDYRDNFLESSDLETLEEITREQCEHLTRDISSIKTIFQEDSTITGQYRNWCQHWLIETSDGYKFCYPINVDEYGIYESGLVPDWRTIDSYEFNGKFYQVIIDGVLRNEHLENSPNHELSVYKSSLKQIQKLGVLAVGAAEKIKKELMK